MGPFIVRGRLLAVCVALVNTCCAETVILVLHNGDRITGEMISIDTKHVTITNALIGKISLPIAEVQKLERQSPPKADSTPAPSRPATVGTTNAPAATTSSPATATSSPAPSAAAKATPPPAQPKPKPPKRWNLVADLGVDLQYNQRERQLYYGRAKWNYTGAGGRFRGIADYIVNYGWTEGPTPAAPPATNTVTTRVLSANDMNGSVKLELDVTKRFFVFDAAGAGYNEIRKIDFGYDNSFGLGYKVLNNTNVFFSRDNLILNTELGGNYQEQFFSDGTTRDYFSLRLGELVAWKINTKLSFDQKFEYYPRFTGWDDYRLRFEANLRYLVMPNLTLSLTAIDLYDTQPAPGVSRNDLLLRGSIGVKF